MTKKKTTEDEDKNKELDFDTKLDILKYMTQVHSRVHTDINSDFILAKLDEKDKKNIIKMTEIAYLAKRISHRISNQLRIQLITEKNKKTPDKKNIELLIAQINYITSISNQIFDGYMTKIYLTVSLNRNVPKNHLINILGGQEEDEKTEESEQEITKGIKSFFKEKLGRQDT